MARFFSFPKPPLISRSRCLLGSLLLVPLVLALLVSCSQEPSGVNAPGENNTGKSDIVPGSSGEFLLASVEGGDFAAGRVEIWAYNLTTDPDSGIVAFDAVVSNATDMSIYPPIKFVITSISPPSVTVANPDGFDGTGHPYFDYSDKLGSDGLLSPGERSNPAHCVFHTGTPKSFIIGYRFDFEWAPSGKSIIGAVFNDLNANGIRERCEPPMPGITVTLDSRTSDNGIIHMTVQTGDNGGYAFNGLPDGVYNVAVTVPSGWKATTPNPVLVTLTGDQENMIAVIFGLYGETPIPPEFNLFGPIMVGPWSPFGAEVDSTFNAPPDTVMTYAAPKYFLEVQYPPIMAPIPLSIDTVQVLINDVPVYEYYISTDSTATGPQPGLTALPYGLVHDGENKIYIKVKGDDYAALYFRVFAAWWLRQDC
jgi:hypothetical protein